MKLHRAYLTGLAASSALFFAGAALAQAECTKTCPSGQQCEWVYSDCPPVAPCEPGANCPTSDCSSQAVETCVDIPGCKTDADCGSGATCVEQTAQQCSGSAVACAPGMECPPPEPPTCSDYKYRSCIAKPCEADADCGEGFTCEATCGGVDPTSGGSGSVGTSTGTAGAASGGPAELVAPPSTGTGGTTSTDPKVAPPGSAGGSTSADPVPPVPMPTLDGGAGCTQVKQCVLKPVPCNADSDCATGWKCNVVSASTGGCAGPGTEAPGAPAPNTDPGASADAGAAIPDPGTLPPMPTCDPMPTIVIKQCQPPNYTGPGKGGDGSVGLPTSGNGQPSPGGEQTGAPPTAPTPAAPGGGDDGASSGSASPSSSDDGGCQIGAGRSSVGSAALLGLLGLIGIGRRRRRA